MSTFEHNKVDIYIKERNGTRKIRVPWLPASITYTAGGMTVATYDILNEGEVDVPSGTGLAKISWDSQLPGKNRNDKTLQRGTWQAPSTYHKIFEEWLKKGTSLNVLVTGYPINKNVFLSSYEATPGGGFGDMEYSIEFTEERDITITSEKIKTDQNSTSKRPSKKSKAKTYKVKRGDTLWGISRRFLKSGKKWKTIYKANKKIIEKTAKKHGFRSSNNGWWIFPGTKLTIPKK